MRAQRSTPTKKDKPPTAYSGEVGHLFQWLRPPRAAIFNKYGQLWEELERFVEILEKAVQIAIEIDQQPGGQ